MLVAAAGAGAATGKLAAGAGAATGKLAAAGASAAGGAAASGKLAAAGAVVSGPGSGPSRTTVRVTLVPHPEGLINTVPLLPVASHSTLR
jgi:hypothetical protein